MKFEAFINEIDRDYNSWSGSEEIIVSSWQEAEEWCKEKKWTGHYYIIDFLLHRESGSFIRDLGRYNIFIRDFKEK